MKKVISIVLIILLLSATSVLANESENVSTFVIGNGEYSINGHIVHDVAPYIKDGRTLLPLRYVAYALGIGDDRIQWNPDTKSAFLLKDDTLVVILVGEKELYVGQGENVKVIQLDVPAEIKDGRTMLPLRAISEAFGVNVEWDDESKAVIISG